MTESLDIRPMSASDMERAVEWAAREGWNPGLHDAETFRACDPDGFLMAFENGAPAAAISVVAYGERFGFLGFYIVAPQMRGRGHGLAIWSAGMARLSDRTIGLDGVVAQQENYRRSGFAFVHRNVRYQGHPDVGTAPDKRVRAYRPSDFPAVSGFDAAHFGCPRAAFLKAWLEAEGHHVFVAEEGGRLAGYGVARPCRRGFKIGPLFAETTGLAEALMSALVPACGRGAEITLDAPEPNAQAVAMTRRMGLAPVFETARMYRGTAPDLPLPHIYGITSFELG